MLAEDALEDQIVLGIEVTFHARNFIRDGKLTMGHAKLLAAVTDKAEQERLAKMSVEQTLTVRNLERMLSALSCRASAR